MSGLIAFAQINVYDFVGGIVQGVASTAGAVADAVTKLATHAVVGGAFAVAQGGEFATGAFTGAISAASSVITDMSGVLGKSGDGNVAGMIGRTAIAAAAGGTASVLLHAAAAAIMPWAVSETGTLDEATEAISIELLASNVIEQAVADAIVDAAQSPAATAVMEGEAIEAVSATAVAEAVDVAGPKDAAVEETSALRPDEVQSVISGEAAQSEVAFEVTKPKPQEAKRNSEPKKSSQKDRINVADLPAKTTDKGRAEATRAKGGVASRGSTDRSAVGGRVSASAGSISGYAARVRARVAANKPSASGRGTAVVSFRVTSSGGLASARLTRSSGIAAIDQAAVSAVRWSAPFPSPPPGASQGQLAFTFPFHFR